MIGPATGLVVLLGSVVRLIALGVRGGRRSRVDALTADRLADKDTNRRRGAPVAGGPAGSPGMREILWRP
jgi:hypothetical protein